LSDDQVLIDFDKAPDKARDKVYSTAPGGGLVYNFKRIALLREADTLVPY
jgi:hypothetical protein